MTFIDRSSNFHPYECDGLGRCIHCDRYVTSDHDPRSCALCQPIGGEVNDQAASQKRKYVILESQTHTIEQGDEEPIQAVLWAHTGIVEAISRQQAVTVAATRSSEWEGGTLVAIPEGSWVPQPVKVETKRNVTIG